jgi:Ethylbenzene dehydrogenase/Prokaryotic cytochrome b561
MRRFAIRRRTDIGTILLHWLIVVTLATSIATGLRIAADEPERRWLLVFDLLLPKDLVWTAHAPAALVLCALAVSYVAYLISARLFRRVQLDRVRLAGLFKGAQARWGAINTLLYWIFFTAVVAEIVTGAQLYLGYASGAVARIHLFGTWIILAFVPAHIGTHWAIGGFAQLMRIFRPSGFASPAPRFDPMEVVEQLNRQIEDAKKAQLELLRRKQQPPESVHSKGNVQAGVRGQHPARSIRTVQANPLAVALAAMIVTVGFVLPIERATQDRLYIRKIATANVPILDGDASDPIWLTVKPLTVRTAFGGNFDGEGDAKIDVRAVHDGERVYFCFIWDDPTRSLKHLPMVKNDDGWHVLQDRYDLADAHEYYEDKFSVLLTQLDVIIAGDRTFHVGPMPLADKPATLSGRGLHYTESPSVPVEVWQWKASSTGQYGHVDQDRFGMPAEPTPAQSEGRSAYRGGYIADPRAARLYWTNFDTLPLGGYRHAIQPERLPKNSETTMAALGRVDLDPAHGESDGSRWSMTEAESEPYSIARDSQIPVGTIIPGLIVAAPPDQNFGEVRGVARWAAGRWMLEVSRSLRGDHPGAVPVSTGTYMRLAAFDHAQTHHTRHLRPILLEVE